MAEEGLRKDGRKQNQLRVCSADQGLLNRADSSSRFSLDNTVVIASVSGPRDVAYRRNELVDRAYIGVTFYSKEGFISPLDKERAAILRQTLSSIVITTMHPRKEVSITVQVVSDDGAVLAAAINASFLALSDAGIDMLSMCSAVAVCVGKDNSILLDPTLAEETASAGSMVFAFSNSSPPKLLTSVSDGIVSRERFCACLQLGRKACQGIVQFHKLALEQKLRRVFAVEQEPEEAMDVAEK